MTLDRNEGIPNAGTMVCKSAAMHVLTLWDNETANCVTNRLLWFVSPKPQGKWPDPHAINSGNTERGRHCVIQNVAASAILNPTASTRAYAGL